MLETAIALVFAHALADFVFQPAGMARRKREPAILGLHGIIVTVVTWAALGFPPAPLPLAILGLTHVAIDAYKAWRLPDDFASFLSDQAAHLMIVAALALAFPDLYARGMWAGEVAPPLGALLPHMPAGMALLAGLVLTTRAGGFAIGRLMAGLPPLDAPPGAWEMPTASLPAGGAMIGQLERALIFLFLLTDHPNAIGFLIAAKSILRFGEIQQDRRAAEYVIIGTLASFAWALALTHLTILALDALAP